MLCILSMDVCTTIGPMLPVLTRGSAKGAGIGVVDDDDDDDEIADNPESRELSPSFVLFFIFFSFSAPFASMSTGIDAMMAVNSVD